VVMSIILTVYYSTYYSQLIYLLVVLFWQIDKKIRKERELCLTSELQEH